MGMKTLLTALMVLMVLTGSAVANPARNWTGIVVHHSDSGPETTRDDIDLWHKQKGWDGCGYHFVIEWDGSIKYGRSLSKAGAHAKTGKPYSRNSTHIGICLVGRDKFTDAQLRSLKGLVKNLSNMFPIQSVERHHEQCPGKAIDVESLDKSVKEKVKK